MSKHMQTRIPNSKSIRCRTDSQWSWSRRISEIGSYFRVLQRHATLTVAAEWECLRCRQANCCSKPTCLEWMHVQVMHMHRMRVIDARYGADEAGIAAGNASATNMVLQCQLVVDDDSKVNDGWLALQCGWAKSNWTGIHLGKLLSCTMYHPDELGFDGIQLPLVRCHPSLDFGDTNRNVRHHGWGQLRPFLEIQPTVVGVVINVDVKLLRYEWYICCVEVEEHREWPWRHWTLSILNIFTCCIRLNDRSGTRTGFWEGACKIPWSPSVDDSPCMRSMTFEIGDRPETINVILFQSHLFSILEWLQHASMGLW